MSKAIKVRLFEPYGFEDRTVHGKIRVWKEWLDERNIKYFWVRTPEWSSFPTHIVLVREEDATLFKLTFEL